MLGHVEFPGLEIIWTTIVSSAIYILELLFAS
jgi:hypothetical protein